MLATATAGTRRDGRVIGLAVILAAAAVLAGCGGSGSSTPSSSGPSQSTSASTPAASTTATTAASSTSAAGASTTSSAAFGLTAGGAKLALGTSALVDYEPGGSPKPTYRLQLSVLSIRKGTQTELDGVELEKSDQNKTPYYVTLRIENVGSGDAGAEENVPASAFQATDDRGQQGQELSVIGNFRPCPSATQPKPFSHGRSYQTCLVYLVGGSGSIVAEQWTGNGADAYSEHPIVWRAG